MYKFAIAVACRIYTQYSLHVVGVSCLFEIEWMWFCASRKERERKKEKEKMAIEDESES